jgi:5-deoxy-glucuronate isomerase
VPGYETCVVPATGTVTVETGGRNLRRDRQPRRDVWDGEPEGVYVPTDTGCRITALTDTETFIAGAKYAETLKPFAVRATIWTSCNTARTTPRRTARSSTSSARASRPGRPVAGQELFTVGQGGWSGFPSHKHDTDRLPDETRHDECYNFRFKPNYGSGVQMLQRVDNEPGDAYHIVDGSTVLIDKGYHPCCVLPGYEMYYFTILGGLSPAVA